jgi:chromosome segregation ATPase
MATEQIEKRLAWLDDQHRKNADALSLLKDRDEAYEDRIEQHEKQIRELSSEVARLGALSTKMMQFNEALDKQRTDFSQQLENALNLQGEREKHHEQLRKSDRDQLSRTLSEVQVNLEQIDEIKNGLEARRHEEIRFNRELDQFSKKLDAFENKAAEWTRSLSSLDQSKKLEAKRVADLQSETTDLRVKIDSMRGSLDAIEDRIRRSEQRLSDLVSGESNRMEAQTLWIEQQELKLLKFEKDWSRWRDRFEDFEKKADTIDERILRYDENYRAMKQTKSDLEKMLERLERRITEISEIQRITENRLKQDWTNFQADEQKRWNTFKLNNDEQWRDHNRGHEKSDAEVDRIKETIEEKLGTIDTLAELSDRRVMELLALIRDWAAELETSVGEVK